MASRKNTDEVQIVVSRVLERNGYWNVLSDDDVWYGLGKKEPNFDKGATIQFEYSENGKYKNVEGRVNVISNAEAPTRRKATASDIMTKDDYWRRKEENDIFTQREIRWQASRNAALEFMKMAFSVDALPLSKKGADKEELLNEYLNTYTQQFYTDTFAIRERSEELVSVESLTNNNNEDTFEDDDLESLR